MSTVPPYAILGGIENPTSTNADASTQRTYGDPENQHSNLLTLPEPDAAKRALRLWKDRNTSVRHLEAQWEANAARRGGHTGVKVVASQDDSLWRVRYPLDSQGNRRSMDATPTMNKAASLSRKLTGLLMADPPAPDATPGDGEEQDEDAAQFATRALNDLNETMGEVRRLTDAIDRCHSCASVFTRYYFNKYAGKRVPIEVEAGYDPTTGEEARHIDEAEFHDTPLPYTAEEQQYVAMGVPVQPTYAKKAWPRFRTRMVAKDGTLTDDRKLAATRVQGELVSENLPANNVRLIPWTATHLDEAQGVQVLSYVAWGDVARDFPEAAKLPDAERDKILAFHPSWADGAYPPGQKQRYEKMRQGEDVDAKPCLTLSTYYTGMKSGEYPLGLYMLQLGETHVLYRGTLSYKDPEGTDQPMLLPMRQVRLFTEARDHAYGVGLMEILGPGGEARAWAFASVFDALERITRAKTFYDQSSTVQPDELADPARRYIEVNMAAGIPVTEQVQGAAQESQIIIDTLTAEMNDASSLQETGQGLENSDVTSGVQAMTVVAQVQAALSPQARAVTDAFLRGQRIVLELVRAHFTVPRQIKWSTEDGRYKQKGWSRVDIGSTSNVRLKAGTMSMLTSAQKALLAQQYGQMGLLPPEDVRDALEGNLGGTLALQSDPFRMRIRRQLSDWKEGPPEGWAPQQPVQQQNPDGTVSEQSPPDPALSKLFEPVPSDETPEGAAVRFRELSRLMQSTDYTKWPAGWRTGVDDEWRRMQTFMQLQAQQPLTGPSDPQQAQQQSPQQQPPTGVSQQPAPPTRVHQQAQESAMNMPVGAAQGG